MTMATNNNKLLYMKKILINIGLLIGLFAAFSLNACKENIDPVVEELSFSRAFSPINLSAVISNQTTVTITWAAVKDADQYVLEIYQGTDVTTGTLITTETLTSDVLTYSILLTGDTKYVARLKAISALNGVEDSKWSEVAFTTAPENLFTNYNSYLSGLNQCIVNWKPGQNVTGLVFVNGSNTIPYTLNATEIANGSATVSSLPNASYTVRLMYNTVVRGITNVLIEGDVLLPAGGDLKATIKGMSAGQVLILENGATYGLAYADTITTSIKIRAIYTANQPVIYLASAATGQSNHMFDIAASVTSSDSLVFENVTLTGYYDNGTTTRHRGFIDEEATAFDIGTIKFKNCILRNSGRSAIRLRGGSYSQVIRNVIFDGCIMYDYAWDSHYGVLNGGAGGNFYNITFKNSTLYNLRGGIINYTAGAGCTSVLVDNCTFNQIMMDASTARYFIDFGSGTNNTSAGPITISDCIFGQTSAIALGVRNSAMTLSVAGSYYTSDFATTATTLSSLCTSYAGASSALWKAPLTADFTFLDTSFAGKTDAGDPRWK
jgi:hypothetical protein